MSGAPEDSASGGRDGDARADPEQAKTAVRMTDESLVVTRAAETDEISNVTHTIRLRVSEDRPESFDGAQAAEVFRLLEAGVPPTEIVRRTHYDPRAVTAMRASWRSLHGSFEVPRELAREVNELRWLRGVEPIRDAPALLANLRASVPMGPCESGESCGACEYGGRVGLAELCKRCAAALSARDAESRERQAKAREDDVQRRGGMWMNERRSPRRSLANPSSEPSAASTASEPAPGPSTAGDRLLKRREAAQVLEMSESTFRRRVEGKLLVPQIGADGIRRYPENLVRRLIVERRTAEPTADAYDGATAARVFDLLERGVHPVQVVQEAQIHPHAVAAIHGSFAELRDGYLVPAQIAHEISGFPWLPLHPIVKASDLAIALRGALVPLCQKCRGAPAEYCARCSEQLVARNTRTKKSLAEMEAAMKSERG
jgi:hypothetical protein